VVQNKTELSDKGFRVGWQKIISGTLTKGRKIPMTSTSGMVGKFLQRYRRPTLCGAKFLVVF
jgi:hypothetical protein